MRQKNRRPLLVATLAIPSVAAATVLAGCAPGGTDDNGGEGEPVTITLATETRFGEDSAYEDVITAFNESNDQNITVELQEIPTEDYYKTIRTQFQAGNAPDVVWGSPGNGSFNALGPFAEAGQLVDLSGEDWATSSIPESSHELYYSDNVLTAVPVDVAPISQVINVTAYESAGLEYATTFDEVLDQCAAVRDAGLTSLLGVAGAQTSNTGLVAMELAASTVYAEDPDWNEQRAAGDVSFADSDGWKQALEDFLTLNEQGCFQPGAEGGSPETVTPEFAGGKILGIFAPAGIAVNLATVAPDSEISVGAFPGETAEDTFLFASPSNALAINAASPHVDAAKALLEFWMQPEQLDSFAEVSGNVSLTSILEGTPVADRFASLETYLTDPERNAPLPNLVWPNTEVYDALGTGVQGLITGQTTVDDVLQAMDAAWQG
ncbi:ABC transporter substrate-binding protein [Microbacterium trichothecenolyticum]|uniref:ABC transporter substrate-binding protein n=1 Tax=Microbacterium trichothecenolyticum TaxID=69370 RepID=UPI0035BE1D84